MTYPSEYTDPSVYKFKSAVGVACDTLENNLHNIMRLYGELNEQQQRDVLNEIIDVASLRKRFYIVRWALTYPWADVHFQNDVLFRNCCYRGCLEEAQWIYSFGNVDVHAEDEDAFVGACSGGHLHVAKWLYSIQPDIDISINNDDAIVQACDNDMCDVVEWLIEIGANAHAQDDITLQYAIEHKNVRTQRLIKSN